MHTPFADSGRMDILRKSAAYIIEYELVTYLGFCEPGTALLTDYKWSILRITESSKIPGTDAVPVTTEFKWAQGSAAFNLQFSEHLTYDYKFQTF
jgi:hypothetical protein